MSRFVSQDMRFFLSSLDTDDLAVLRDLMEAGAVEPVIDRTYPFMQLPVALAYLEEGHARGKVVVTFGPSGN